MSLEGLLKEIDQSRRNEQEKMINSVREQYDALIKSKDEEIAVLKEEIATLRCWLDHSALPAHNPISKRKDSMGLIKMNFGKDKPCPDMWAPGERDMLDSIPRKQETEPANEWQEPPKLENTEKTEPGPIPILPDPPVPEPDDEALPEDPKADKPKKARKTKSKRKKSK